MVKKKLRDRDDVAGNISKELVMTMFEKIFCLRSIKTDLLKSKRKEVERVEMSFNKDLAQADRDIYGFENAIKKITGSNEFHYMQARYRESLMKPVELDMEERQKAECEVKAELPQEIQKEEEGVYDDQPN